LNFECYFNENKEKIKKDEDINKYLKISFEKASIEAQDFIRLAMKKFKKGIEEIIEKEKSNSTIKDYKIDIDTLIHNSTQINTTNQDNLDVNLVTSVSILSALISGGAGVTLFIAPTGIFSAASTLVLSTLGIGAAFSTTAIIGMVAFPVAIGALIAAYVMNKKKKEEFQQKLAEFLDENINKMKQDYSNKIREMESVSDKIVKLLNDNISKEFQEIHERKFQEFDEIIKLKESNIDVNMFKDISKKIDRLKI
jgi:uncharacterized membrane-anchored protein YhcB (DUF1043 family)